MLQTFNRIFSLFSMIVFSVALISCSQNPEVPKIEMLVIGDISPPLSSEQITHNSRIIIYTHDQITEQVLVSTLQKAVSNCNLSYIRLLSTGGHLINLACKNKSEMTKTFNKIEYNSLIKTIEFDRILNIGS